MALSPDFIVAADRIQTISGESKFNVRLGATHAMDDHNHPHAPMQIVGVRDGKVADIAEVGR
jgi:hypothetical protein